MSYDLIVFEAEGAPRELSAFVDWHIANAEAAEESETSLKMPASDRFAAFYDDMVVTYPDMNGPSGEGMDEGERLTGYEFQPKYILMDFRWSVAEDAFFAVMTSAQAHGLGVYDLNDAVIYPGNEPHSAAVP